MRYTILTLLLAVNCCHAQERVSHAGLKCYFGVLHAHSVLSPDFAPPKDLNELTQIIASTNSARFTLTNGPMEAWTIAADEAKLDFLALTDHVHGPEAGQGEFCEHEMPDGGYRLLLECAEKINTDPARQGKFLAIPGMEWSSISSGNHINIFFAKHAVKSSIKNGDFEGLLEGYLLNPEFEGGNTSLLVQLNHPNQNGGVNGVRRNYGRNRFPPTQAADSDFVKDYGNIYMAIEHINNSNGGNENASASNAHRDGDDLSFLYRTYLNMGLRLAPVGDHDNHRKNWGRHTAARTGVWTTELTKAKFVEAYKDRRVFATEDNELAVAFLCREKWMGSSIAVADDGEVVEFTVHVDQIVDTDQGSDLDEGPYIVELFGDEDGIGGAIAERVSITISTGEQRSSVQVNQGETVRFKRRVAGGNYYYVHVRETNGQDAGGENADAWTAPIFFVTASHP